MTRVLGEPRVAIDDDTRFRLVERLDEPPP